MIVQSNLIYTSIMPEKNQVDVWGYNCPSHHSPGSGSLQSSSSKDDSDLCLSSLTRWVCCSWWTFRHFIRRFWNQTFTWASVSRKEWARYSLSGPTMYWVLANSPSSRSNCSAVKIVRTRFVFPGLAMFKSGTTREQDDTGLVFSSWWPGKRNWVIMSVKFIFFRKKSFKLDNLSWIRSNYFITNDIGYWGERY